jgi:L-gulonolactone oxidase
MTRWTNWAGNQTCTPAEVAVPRDAAEVTGVVRRAAERGLAVRPVGAGHSFTGVALTDGVQLRLDALAGLSAADPATGLVTLGAGTRLRDVPALLAPYGLAMTNLGDIDAQTLAGAISTGTHGTGARFGGLATQVWALRLVLADGTEVACSADERPDLFAAARVGLGALGVLTAVTLRCVPAFLLRADERPVPLDEAPELLTADDHVEFYWFPHTDRALLKRNTRLPPEAGLAPLTARRAWWEDRFLANTVFGWTCRLGHRVPAAVPMVNQVAARALGARTYTDRSHRVFTSAREVRFRELEYAVPVDALTGVLAELRRTVRRNGWRISFPVEVRVAAADDIWLSTAYGRDTGYVAVHRYHRESPDEYFRAVEAIMLAAGGRPHWGKEHHQGAAVLAERYPRFADFRRVRAEVDPAGVFANAYTDRVLGRDALGSRHG